MNFIRRNKTKATFNIDKDGVFALVEDGTSRKKRRKARGI